MEGIRRQDSNVTKVLILRVFFAVGGWMDTVDEWRRKRGRKSEATVTVRANEGKGKGKGKGKRAMECGTVDCCVLFESELVLRSGSGGRLYCYCV